MRQHQFLILVLIAVVVITLIITRETEDEKTLREAKEKAFLRPYYNFPADYFTAYQYNITTCSIRKSMSQMVFNTMCLLHDPESFLEGNHSISDTWESNRTCKYEDKDRFGRFPDEFKNKSSFTRLVFVRDPFDRFISFYLDKCVRKGFCFDCLDDMRCVVKRIYDTLTNHSTSPEFYTANFTDMHSAPLSWFCQFDRYLKAHHVLIIGPEIENRQHPIMELTEILEKKNVSDKLILKIVKETLLGETSHGTHNSDRRKMAELQIKNDPIVREYLHKIYLNDYLIFPFDRSPLDPEYQDEKWDELYKQQYANIITTQDYYSKLLN